MTGFNWNALTKREAEREIAEIKAMSPEAVMELYNVDTVEEAVRGVLESVGADEEYDYADGELEQEREYLCASQGLARFC